MIRIVTDSVASIPAEMAKERNIEVISLFVRHNGKEYVDATMDVDEFYKDIYGMLENLPTSSQPSQQAFEERFESIANAGDELLGVFISEKMSGTYDRAVAAAKAVKERVPSFVFRVVNSASNSFDEAWSVVAAADARDEGKSLDECVERVLSSIESTRWLFSPETLTFLQAGGRIGKATAIVGNLVKLCPVLTVSDGETATFGKVRTHAKALGKMTKKFAEDVNEFGFKNAVVHYIGDPAEAKQWAREAIEPICERAIQVIPVSPVIGAHVGPAVGIAYECTSPLPGKLTTPLADLVYSS